MANSTIVDFTTFKKGIKNDIPPEERIAHRERVKAALEGVMKFQNEKDGIDEFFMVFKHKGDPWTVGCVLSSIAEFIGMVEIMKTYIINSPSLLDVHPEDYKDD
jgi:hypothetical protein